MKTLPIRTILIALMVSLAVNLTLRTALHIFVSEGPMRYGLHWEALLPFLLISLALLHGARRYFLVLTAIVLVAIIFQLGQTRALLLGVVAGAGILAMFALYSLKKNKIPAVRMGIAAVTAIVVIMGPMLMPTGGRINLASAFETTADAEMECEGGGKGSTAKEEWEVAIACGGLGMETRLAEAKYFLELVANDFTKLIIGVGAGRSDSVTLSDDSERVVRGPHVTYANFIYRHGIFLGVLISLMLVFYGLWPNLRQVVFLGNSDLRLLILSLVAYRLSASAMAIFHQGLIDDPFIFLAIAISTVPYEHLNPISGQLRR